MNRHTHTNLVTRSSLALAVALSLGLVIWSSAQAGPGDPADGTKMTDAKMMANCQEMKAEKEKMMAEMKAQDADLTAQVTKVNSAPDDKKLGLVAAVVTQIVEQHTAMTVRMEKMQGKMMQHMMAHMQMGKESMSQCSMMKGMKDMKGMDDSSANTHEEQK